MTAPAITREAADPGWERLAELLSLVHDLDSRAVHWSAAYPLDALPPGLDCQDAAVQLARDEADDARRALVSEGSR